MFKIKEPIKVNHLQKLANQSMMNDALVIEVISNSFSESEKNFVCMKNIFPLEFTKYLSYSQVQKNSKVVNAQIRSLRVCSKSVTETLYGNKFFVSECIFKYSLSLRELQVIRDQLGVRGIPEKSLNRMLLLLVLKTSHRRCSVKKRALENLASFTGKYLCWSIFLINLQA